ncbi:6-phosphogluconolactonase [Kocuria sp. LUK]|uniref:6-phosphogluconolactonase n=1 Tax=Kocuria sp. LUK TaxID=2897828 RepID=UPI001E331FE5|nr:6-phosphogluconolactonase [Kocuria sp. LUK]MCD1144001.1 6-phosphogluconolactonase [Kocuria sp. LUK]
MSEPETVVHPDAPTLAEATAGRVLDVLAAAQEERGEACVVLTGGGMGTAVLAAVAASPGRSAVDWSRVDVWWSDERFTEGAGAERNCVQAAGAVGGALALDPDRVHCMGSADDFASPEEAAEDYLRELAAAAAREGRDGPLPRFDLSLLGLGPDGHVASLFPGLPHVHEERATVLGVRDSPKPPPQRVSMTLPLINAAERVWLLVAGAEKAQAVAAVRAGAPVGRTPGAGVRGAQETLLLLARDAAGA